MKKIANVLLLISLIGALMACAYVLCYNAIGVRVENKLILHGGSVAGLALTLHFLNLQWYAFLFPFAGLVLGLRFRKLQNEVGVFLVSAFMVFFALSWAFLAILAWQFQSIAHRG